MSIFDSPTHSIHQNIQGLATLERFLLTTVRIASAWPQNFSEL